MILPVPKSHIKLPWHQDRDYDLKQNDTVFF